MSRFTSGTKTDPARLLNKWMESYTDQQLAALEEHHTGEHVLKIARAKFANHVLLPDGTVSADLDQIRECLQTAVSAAMIARQTAQSALMLAMAVEKKSPSEETRGARFIARSALSDATNADNASRDKQLEFEEHVAQERFLFVVDDEGTPTVYFQCAVDGNPDMPMRTEDYTPAYVAKVEAEVAAAAASDRRELLANAGKALGMFLLAVVLGKFGAAAVQAKTMGVLLVGAISYKISTGNYLLDQLYDNKFPVSSIVSIRTGAAAGPDNAAGGTELVPITTPATPWAAAASKSKAKSGTWSGSATNTGTAAHYRFKNSGDTEREEGTVTATGGGGDMVLDNVSIASSQTVTINTYTRTAA